ncbi:MAG: methylglyoxal synthase [Ignavibacteriales bacterium CG_4_9_14_3_um_filter_30_11]|nr:MAG: methylglyoxal synthase [Ignavibacteriales bacterium CG_4_9_14_3_um_filter_30_11]
MRIKNIALVAHDNRKSDLIEWAIWNYEVLMPHNLICTGTTGKLVEVALNKKSKELDNKLKVKLQKLKSGPLGGDQQLGSLIVDNKVDFMIFFWDPMEPHPHDVDVKALLRISVLYNIPIACNRATADFMISSKLMNEDYERIVKDYNSYIKRDLN